MNSSSAADLAAFRCSFVLMVRFKLIFHKIVNLFLRCLVDNADASGSFDGLNFKRKRVLLKHAGNGLDSLLSCWFCLFHSVTWC